jgi:phosphatidylglycerol:prolipoprotein diacylglycerol transferase
MFPTLLDFGTHELPLLGETHLFLPTYGTLFATATVLAWWWFLRRGRTLGVPNEDLFNLSFYTILAGILGAKLTLVVIDWDRYAQHPGELWGTLRSAGVLMGGVIAGALMFVTYARRHGLPLSPLGDAIAAPLAFAQGVGRLGCYCAGCCWGVPSAGHGWLALTFTDPMARAQTGVPLHVALVPMQLYQMANDLLLAAVLTWLWWRRPRPAGTVFWVYVLFYSITRGILEFWRGDPQRGLYFDGSLSTSQLIALAGVVLGLVMLVYGRRQLRSGASAEAVRARR